MSSSIYWQGSGPGLIEGSNRVARVPLEASILNIMCEGRKWLSNGYIYREFGVDFGYNLQRYRDEIDDINRQEKLWRTYKWRPRAKFGIFALGC
jgi:hypothetical protein